ncbi:hypothetical protein TgHK011_009559 [Trichoderma gracile]|nr:hypothetical protein TgHK011_009559 [Trichoderma gracile]
MLPRSPCYTSVAQILNPTDEVLRPNASTAYIVGGTAGFCYFFLPTLKHRTYHESSIFFSRRMPAEVLKLTIIDVADHE